MSTRTPRWSSGGIARVGWPRTVRAFVLGLALALGALASSCGSDSGDEFDCEEDEECDDLFEVS